MQSGRTQIPYTLKFQPPLSKPYPGTKTRSLKHKVRDYASIPTSKGLEASTLAWTFHNDNTNDMGCLLYPVHMVVSQNSGTPIWTPIYYILYYRAPKKGTHDFSKLPYPPTRTPGSLFPQRSRLPVTTPSTCISTCRRPETCIQGLGVYGFRDLRALKIPKPKP